MIKVQTISAFTILILCQFFTQAQSTKMQLWQAPNYFHGFNMTTWDNRDALQTSQADFDELKAIGANLVNIQIPGPLEVYPPYDELIWYAEGNDTTYYIEILEEMVSYAQNADLYYVISIRSGPGRHDVSNTVDTNTIWYNTFEQDLYAEMVKAVAEIFADDPLFVGYDVLIEPNPKYKIDGEEIEPTLAEAEWIMDLFDIDVNALYTKLINAVREVTTDLPIMVEGIYFSDPEYFSLVNKQDDPNIVYKVHMYNPGAYTHFGAANMATYPDNYYSKRLESFYYFDSTFLIEELYKPVREFQETHDVPIYIGEFGLSHPQVNGKGFLKDVADIACTLGWHYALWVFNDGPEFNYRDIDEIYGTDYWPLVQTFMDCQNITSVGSVQTNKTNISPNPTDGYVHIGSEEDFSKIEVFDIQGRVVFSKDYEPYTFESNLDLNDLEDSIYFIFITTGDRVSWQKLVIIK